jgi:hypothetical protein
MFVELQGFHVRRMKKLTINMGFLSFLNSILVVLHKLHGRARFLKKGLSGVFLCVLCVFVVKL